MTDQLKQKSKQLHGSDIAPDKAIWWSADNPAAGWGLKVFP